MRRLAMNGLLNLGGDFKGTRHGFLRGPRQPWGGWLLLLAVSLIAPFGANAQLAGTGAIAGTVTDSTGAVVADAVVTAISVATNEKTIRSTTRAGDYNITPLTPGVYTVTVAAKGFQKFVQEKVTVDALTTVSIEIKLSVGSDQQTVTITSAPPELDTADATLGAVMDNAMYSSLPLEMGQGGNADQRRATDFAYLMPGVQSNYVGSNNSTDASGSVNGGNPAGDVSEIYIDGINLPEADGVGDPRFTWSAIGVDAIDQFQVQTAGYSSQYAGQGVQNYSIKQGSNQIHGSIYEYLRNTVLDAWKFTSKVPTTVIPKDGGAPTPCVFGSPASSSCVPGGIKSQEIMNEFGIVLGGPIIKNKLFLFYNYGQYRNQNGPVPKAQTIPTAAMLGYTQSGAALGYADFSGYAAANPGYHIYDPATQTPDCAGTTASPCLRTQFPNDQIPASRFSAASNYINKFMLPYEQEASQTTYSNNIVTGYPSGLANWYQTGRLDYDMSPKNQISLIIAFGRQASTGPNSSGATNQLGPPFNTNQAFTPKTNVDILRDTFEINPHLVNQFAVAFGRYKSLSVTPDDTSLYAASTMGLTNTPAGQATDGFPGISFSGTTTCPATGTGIDNPCNEAGYDWNQKVNNTYTVMDNLQWEHGKHNITAGGQVVEVQFNYIKNLTYSSPLTYTFSPSQTEAFTTGTSMNGSTGSSVASYMLGAVSSSSVTVGVPELGSRWLNPSFWVQDDYKVTPKLTLNLGLRWDIFPSIHEVHNVFTWLNPTGANSVTGNMGTLESAGSRTGDFYSGKSSPSSIWYKNVAPRVGLAYSVDPKTVIRASYNLAFARGNWTSGSQSGSPSTTGLTPSATAAAGLSGAPQFYWDNAACTAGTNDEAACGWTGSIAQPAPPAGGTSLAEFGTTETVALKNGGSASMTYFDPYLGSRTPEYINWTFGLQREITKDMTLTISYVGSEGHFISAAKAIGARNNELPESMAALAGYNVAGGAATPCSGNGCTTPLLGQKATAANLNLAAGLGFAVPNPYNSANAAYYASNSVYQYYYPFPQFSAVSDTTSFVGNENWNALEISLRERMSHGLNFMLNYTYSKGIDDLGTFRVGDNTRLDRSLSTADLPQNLTGTVVYQLPFGRGHIGGDNFVVRSIASDWNLSGIVVYHSGSPIAVTGSGCGGDGILNQCMPNVVSGQPGRINGRYGKNVTAAPGSPNYIGNIQYLNPAAFAVNISGTAANYGTTTGQAASVGNGPALYVPGDAPRVGALNLWGMSAYDVDLAIRRVFPIYREWKFQLEADFLNATNHVVWAAPAAVANSGGFGEITSLAPGNAPRDVQLSARVSW
jgi:Carboxypeptidase regulatory-like domain